MPTIRVRCPACRGRLKVAAEYAGQPVLCGCCGEVFTAEPDASPPDDDIPRPAGRRRREKGSGWATAGLVCGLIGLVVEMPAVGGGSCCCLPALGGHVFGVLLGLLGLGLGLGAAYVRPGGTAITAVVVSGVALAIALAGTMLTADPPGPRPRRWGAGTLTTPADTPRPSPARPAWPARTPPAAG
jgi:hypothetical protein